MGSFHTDCIEKHLRAAFKSLGYFVGSHPWWFLFTPLLFSTGLGSGFYFLIAQTSNSIEEQFTPLDGPAKMERKYIQETFPRNGTEFSSIRMTTDGTYATLIAATDTNILSVESLQEIIELDFQIKRMKVQLANGTFDYSDVCALVNGRCSSNTILDLINYDAYNINSINLTFPWYDSDYGSLPLFTNLGNVELNINSSIVQSAEAIHLFYYLETDKATADIWLESFLTLLSNQSTSLQVSYSTSMSMQKEFEKSPGSVIFLFSITYTTAIIFSVGSCWRSDNVRTKVWVALCGVLSTGLAILSGFGELLLLEQPFVMTAASCPFMLLGIGLDDMFIMISCWQRTRVLDSVPSRLSQTYSEAAVSITITSITDALALFLGYTSPFGSVKSFCLYAGVSVVFCYLYSITFLGACMALNGQREAGNRHWFTCMKVPEDLPSSHSKVFSVCCIGGRYNRMTEKEAGEPMSYFFERFYGPFLTHKLIKAFVLVIYAAYLAVSLFGCLTIKEGLDIRNLALDDSYIIDFYQSQKQYFSEYSFNVMVAVKQPFPYWDEEEYEKLHTCILAFENLPYVNSTQAWFLVFQQYTNETSLNLTTHESFKNSLSQFLDLYPMFKQDINLTENYEIQASRFFIQTLDRTAVKDAMVGLRMTTDACPIDLLVYHPVFIYYDQFTVVTDTAIQTIMIAVVVMLGIALIMIPNLICCISVAFAICSVVVGVAGFMSLWGVNLDSISLINLVMCIGFSVDFSAHITYAFVSSPKSDANKRAIDSLAQLGFPILQGALSTILGVVVLSMSGSYIFRTFFKIVFLVISFGLVHGLVFLPVFLSLVGTFGLNFR
ncbi:patched domain-containing protein 3 [Periophthalmus magnuspinnatus]|uniref:patched domain-containing protein 3 n=1 Tax=Periophthalmus magnuspinnatus TaxID=409849 RepID=UPI00145B0061|nr:patched domain-containing protein 3 [Periophthalmus magnuspinnatus]